MSGAPSRITSKFGEWFQVKIEAPFAPGETGSGKNSPFPLRGQGFLEFVVQEDQIPESYFSYTWHPYAVDPNVDYSKEEPTLVEFRLAPTASGTLLTVTESGFDKVPAHRRDEAMRMNDGGWAQQVQNIERYVAQKP